MRFDILAIYALAVIGIMNIIYDTGCWITDMIRRRQYKKRYKQAEQWLGRWGA